MHVCTHMWGSLRTTLWSCLSPSTFTQVTGMNSGRAILPVPEGIFFIIFLVCLCFDYNQPHEVKGRIPYLYGVQKVSVFFFLEHSGLCMFRSGLLNLYLRGSGVRKSSSPPALRVPRVKCGPQWQCTQLWLLGTLHHSPALMFFILHRDNPGTE